MTSDPRFNPVEVRPQSPTELDIEWQDGHVSGYTFALLRRSCKCAGCVEEFTGRRVLEVENVPDDLQANDIQQVGLYALRFEFSDGHNTGIYAYEVLRSLCPCAACVAAFPKKGE